MGEKENRIIKKLSQTKRLLLNGGFFIVSLSNIYFYKNEMGKMIYIWMVLSLIFGLFLCLGIYGRNQKKNSED